MTKPLPPLAPNAAETDRASLMILLAKHYESKKRAGRHWLEYHLGKPSAFGLQLLMALAICELAAPGLGFQLMTELGNIPYAQGPKGEQVFEHLLQKLIEVVVLRTLVSVDWPEGTTFQHEPQNPVTKKRPEFVVETPDHVYAFEVKCPGLLEHQRNRARNPQQIPARSSLTKAEVRDRALALVEGRVTLPQDNKLKDFLKSAEEKIAGFQTAKGQTGVLVVAWDRFMYEPISSLNHMESGLFMDASFHRDPDDARVSFAAIDGAILLNHLSLMHEATHEKIGHRPDAFHIEPNCPIPNVWCPNIGGKDLPEALLKAFDAQPAAAMAAFADYAPTEFIMWLNARSPARAGGATAEALWPGPLKT
jgi:hypothetical protein